MLWISLSSSDSICCRQCWALVSPARIHLKILTQSLELVLSLHFGQVSASSAMQAAASLAAHVRREQLASSSPVFLSAPIFPIAPFSRTQTPCLRQTARLFIAPLNITHCDLVAQLHTSRFRSLGSLECLLRPFCSSAKIGRSTQSPVPVNFVFPDPTYPESTRINLFDACPLKNQSF